MPESGVEMANRIITSIFGAIGMVKCVHCQQQVPIEYTQKYKDSPLRKEDCYVCSRCWELYS